MASQTIDRASVEAFIRDHFAAKARCDADLLSTQLSEDLVWWPPVSAHARGFADRPILGSASMVRDITSSQMYNPVGREWTLEQLLVDGDRVAVRARLQARVAATGEAYDNLYSFFIRLEDGRIKEVWEDFDTAYAFDRFAPK